MSDNKRERTTNIRYNASTMKVKCWKRLLSIAMQEEVNQNTISALKTIIDIAEPVEVREKNDLRHP